MRFRIAAVLLSVAALSFAQDYRAKIQGLVTDPDSAAIPNARVILRNTGTGVDAVHQTGQDGRYVFDFVDPGTYTLTVEAAGFKHFEQAGFVVQNRGDVTIDARLPLGAVSESVIVSETPVAVQFNSSSDSTTVGNELMDQMPIRGRNPYNVIMLDPTINLGEASENRPYHHAFADNIDAGGQTQNANDVQLDGVPLTSSYKTSYTPSVEAVGEVSIQKNAVDSEFGYSAGGIVILNMKSGSNRYSGSGYFHNRNPRFNAFGDPTVPRVARADETANRGTNLKMFGGTMGGPVVKNKLFFFTSYEQWDDQRPITYKQTLPTEPERRGDFNQSTRVCRVNNVITPCVRAVYDPLTSTGSSGIRRPYPGNLVPISQFDPVSVKLLPELPLPNLPGNELNWQGNVNEKVNYFNFSGRADWNVSSKLKTFVRYGHFKSDLLERVPVDGKGKLFPHTGSNRNGISVAADTVYVLSTRTVVNLRANYHQLTDEKAVPDALLGKDGMEKLWPGNNWYSSLFTRDDIYYPAIDVGSNNRLGRTGREYWQRPQGWGASARMNWYSGRHQVKFGGEIRLDRGKGARFEPVNLNFRQVLTADRQSGSDLNNSGSEWATYMLGYLDNNTAGRRVPVQEVVTLGYSSYVQDDIKLSHRLTLNLGLRWEFEPGPVDRQDRLSQRLDLTDPIAEFLASPPPIPAAVTNLLATRGYKQQWTGAWIFTTPNNRHAWSRKAVNLLPRIGGAFRIDSRSVARFGYARYMSPSSRIRDPLGDFVNQYIGYSTVTSGIAPLNGLPQSRLIDPFPAGGLSPNPIQLPTGKALGRYTNLGNPVSLDQYELNPQMNDRFTLSYQRSLGRTVASFDWFFNHGINVPFSTDINMADPNFLYNNPRSVTNVTVRNPFLDYLTPEKFPGSLRTTPINTTVGALLRPYPQYGAITQTNTAGKTIEVQSYKLQVQRPFVKGLSLLAAYAYQYEKRTEFFDDRAEFARTYSWRDLPSARHRLNYAVTYQLPFGRGRWLMRNASTPLQMVAGGWQLTSTTRWYSGRPLQFTQSLTVPRSPWIANSTLDRWFDTSAFSRLPDSDRNVPRSSRYTWPGVVGPRTSQMDGTLSKSFPIREHMRLEVRFEAYNALNHLNWDNPIVDFNNSNFGKVISKRSEYIGREIQYGVKLSF
jgi:hypothetical protein